MSPRATERWMSARRSRRCSACDRASPSEKNQETMIMKVAHFALATALSLACLGAAGLIHASTQANPANAELRKLKAESVSVRIGTKSFRVDLYDNPTAKDLLAKLPLTLKAND